MDAMPFIQKLLQRNIQGRRTEANQDAVGPAPLLASSIPEPIFLEALAAFKGLPDFEQRLSRVNEHGQSLLHLAVHLRYRELVQWLVFGGTNLNTKDVNGFTALDAAFLCNDSPIVHILEKRDAIALKPNGPSRPPIKLTSVMTNISVDHNVETTLVNQQHSSSTNNHPVVPSASSRMFRLIPWARMLIFSLPPSQ